MGSFGSRDRVRIDLRRAFVADCSTGLARPDVSKACPSMPASGAPGWTVNFDSTNFSAGWHDLTVQAQSKTRATRDLASLPVLFQR